MTTHYRKTNFHYVRKTGKCYTGGYCPFNTSQLLKWTYNNGRTDHMFSVFFFPFFCFFKMYKIQSSLNNLMLSKSKMANRQEGRTGHKIPKGKMKQQGVVGGELFKKKAFPACPCLELDHEQSQNAGENDAQLLLQPS